MSPSNAVAILALTMSGAVLAACGGDAASSGSSADGAAQTSGAAADEGSGGHGEASPVPDGARHIPGGARTTAFDPDQISVRVGEPIAIVLSSDDVLHDFVVDELDVHFSAAAGETAIGGFQADEPGRYTFYCSVAGHCEAGMEGTVVVETGP